MTYRGKIRDGSVVLDAGVDLPDGVEVEVVLTPSSDDSLRRPSDDSRRIFQALGTLSEKASFEDVIEDIYLLFKIERGVRQLDSGQGIPHEEARQRFSEWLG